MFNRSHSLGLILPFLLFNVGGCSGSNPQPASNSNFSIVNGQIYTPGLAIIDAVS
jgi:hypothetical protein